MKKFYFAVFLLLFLGNVSFACNRLRFIKTTKANVNGKIQKYLAGKLVSLSEQVNSLERIILSKQFYINKYEKAKDTIFDIENIKEKAKEAYKFKFILFMECIPVVKEILEELYSTQYSKKSDKKELLKVFENLIKKQIFILRNQKCEGSNQEYNIEKANRIQNSYLSQVLGYYKVIAKEKCSKDLIDIYKRGQSKVNKVCYILKKKEIEIDSRQMLYNAVFELDSKIKNKFDLLEKKEQLLNKLGLLKARLKITNKSRDKSCKLNCNCF